MSLPEPLRLSLAIDRLTSASSDHYAIWVLDSPFPGGYTHHDRIWPAHLSQLWDSWQQFFSLRAIPQVPHVPSAYVPQFHLDDLLDQVVPSTAEVGGYTGRLMQGFGLSLWEWLFDGPIQQSLERSLGMAMGAGTCLQVRLDIRAPDLIALPWEIMQPQAGQQSVSLGQQMTFARTTNSVEPLATASLEPALRILLVLGRDEVASTSSATDPPGRRDVLQLPDEARALKDLLELSASRLAASHPNRAFCQVDTLVEPDPITLMDRLDRGQYNVFFYAGHGVPAPDGGLLFLRDGVTLSGTELAQVLTRRQIKLAVFNTCWGAQPDQRQRETIPRSSLAEVLLHQGVPAVLAMRDSIADEEALSFIQVFAQALAERQPIGQAVTTARQHLLTAYKFNHPAWTLPVLYLHPQFRGDILEPLSFAVTRIPGDDPLDCQQAMVCSLQPPEKHWPVVGGMMRIGRLPDNDLVLSEPWVSGQHAEIFCRNLVGSTAHGVTDYFLRDTSRNGTYYFDGQHWCKVHREEVPLTTGTQLRFGSLDGESMEFVVGSG